MVDIWLIVVTVVVFILMILLNLYVLAVYLHPDDKGFVNGIFEKIIIILGSTLLWCFVLILPLDIANSRGTGAGFNIEVAYQILFIIYLVFLVFILPMVLFFYETDEEGSCVTRFFKALVYTLVIAVIVFILGLLAWGLLRKGSVTPQMVTSTMFTLSLSEVKVKTTFLEQQTVTQTYSMPYELPAHIFAVVFLIFIGWFLFVMFAGIGISAVPMDLILDFVYR